MVNLSRTLLVLGVIGLLFNGLMYFKTRRFERELMKDLAEAGDEVRDALQPLRQHHGGLLFLSISSLLLGLLILFGVLSGIMGLLGAVVALYGISSLVQSFRSHDTMASIAAAGRDPFTLQSTLRNLRILGVVALGLGLFLMWKGGTNG